jgi:pilus assembly protein Flp/PilA
MTDRKGATAVEYGLIVSLIVVAIIASVNGVANVTDRMWEHVRDESTKAMRNP